MGLHIARIEFSVVLQTNFFNLLGKISTETMPTHVSIPQEIHKVIFVFGKSKVESEESNFKLSNITSLRKQLTFRDATTDLHVKRRLRYERRNSILITCFYPDLGSASEWLKQISHAARPIRSSTQLWVVTRLQYGISALVSQMSFCC